MNSSHPPERLRHPSRNRRTAASSLCSSFRRLVAADEQGQALRHPGDDDEKLFCPDLGITKLYCAAIGINR